jgi:hypothetical protein
MGTNQTTRGMAGESLTSMGTGCCKICKIPSKIRRARRRLAGLVGMVHVHDDG